MATTLKKSQTVWQRVVTGDNGNCTVTVFPFSELLQTPPRLQGGTPGIELGHRIEVSYEGLKPMIFTCIHARLKDALADALAMAELFADKAPKTIGDLHHIAVIDVLQKENFKELLYDQSPN